MEPTKALEGDVAEVDDDATSKLRWRRRCEELLQKLKLDEGGSEGKRGKQSSVQLFEWLSRRRPGMYSRAISPSAGKDDRLICNLCKSKPFNFVRENTIHFVLQHEAFSGTHEALSKVDGAACNGFEA